jgi:putative sugar O-methyltransferase
MEDWQKNLATQKKWLDENGYEDFKRTLNLFWTINFYPFEFLSIMVPRVIAMWDLLYLKYPHRILNQLSEPLEGNPFVVTYKGRFVSYDLAMSAYEYFSISEKINFNDIKDITEVGAGYGRMAFVIKTLHPDIHYRLIDFKQTLDLQKRYLGSVIGLSRLEFIEPNDIYGKCDLLIAVDCLNEFKDDEVTNYLDFINDNAKYFYLSSPKDSIEISRKWEMLFSREHLLREDYFEELYQCLKQQ